MYFIVQISTITMTMAENIKMHNYGKMIFSVKTLDRRNSSVHKKHKRGIYRKGELYSKTECTDTIFTISVHIK